MNLPSYSKLLQDGVLVPDTTDEIYLLEGKYYKVIEGWDAGYGVYFFVEEYDNVDRIEG